MLQMNQLTNELVVAEAMASELSDYLLDDRLFRQIVVQVPLGTQQPKMTLGGLLSRLQMLQFRAAALEPAERSRVEQVAAAVDQARRTYRASWASFVRKEIKSNLDSWRWYMDECFRRGGCASTYPAEVRARVRLALLLTEATGAGFEILAEQGHLRRLDSQLRNVWRDGAFLLDPGLRGLYPADSFWWLYGLPKGGDDDD